MRIRDRRRECGEDELRSSGTRRDDDPAMDMATTTLAHYAAPATLRDGGSVLFRAIRPNDKALINELFLSLGDESRRLRVFGAKSELTARELAYLTELDFAAHVGI